MDKCLKITCPKMAIRWSLYIFINILLFFVVFCFSTSFYFKLIFSIAIICSFFISIKLSGYGFSVFRCFILVKIDSQGVSNAFCKMTWDEIIEIQYETLETKFKLKASKTRIAGNFGLVMFLSKEENKNISFRKYLLKNTICLPFDEKIVEKWTKSN